METPWQEEVDKYGHIIGPWDRIIAAKQAKHIANTNALAPYFETWVRYIEWCIEKEKRNVKRS